MSRPRPKPRRGRAVHVRDAVDFACPFCKGKCSVSEEKEMVLHALPVCAKYLALEPQDFLHAVNEAMENSRLN